MLHNRFNPLRSQHEDTPPANTGTATTTPDAAPEKNETGKEEKKDEQPEPEPVADPAVPAETAVVAPGKLNAFQRTALRALGTGDLIARVERAEAAEAVALAEVARLNTENIRLTSDLTKLKTETPAQIEAAKKVHDKEVSTRVLNELGKIGISADYAPSQTSATESEKFQIKTRVEFDAMPPAARTKFIKEGGKLTD